MNTIPHPNSFLSPGLIDGLRNFAVEAEKRGELHPQQLEKIYEHHLFKLFVPECYGGLEQSLSQALKSEEALAWANGSVGWTVTLCAGANWFIGFLEPDAAKEIFSDPNVCLAGSGKTSGVAEITNGGYQITGRWSYATGTPHATVFTANCMIQKEGKPLQDDSGNLLIGSFWFTKGEVIVHKDWNAMGLCATASHSFEVKNLHVPANRKFVIDAAGCFLNHPVYQFPFLQFAEATLAVNLSGMGIRFLELCSRVFESKVKNENGQKMLMQANEQLYEARNVFYAVAEESWQQLVSHGFIEAKLLNAISSESRKLVTAVKQTAAELFPYCGMSVLDFQTEINRVWRDIHTAAQHSLLRPG